MIKKHKANPLIEPESIKPSREGYRVKGAFNAGAAEYNDEIISFYGWLKIVWPAKVQFLFLITVLMLKEGILRFWK